MAHRRQEKLGQASRAEDVDLELVSSLVEQNVLDRPVKAETGIVDQDIDTATFRQNCADGSLDLVVVGNIHLQGTRADFLQICHLVDASCGHVDPEAVGDEALGNFLAHAGGCTGYKCCFLAVVDHVCLSVREITDRASPA